MTRVLIISASEDTHARAIAKEVVRCGGNAEIIDFATLGSARSVAHRVKPTGRSRRLIRESADRVIDLDGVTSVWWRRPRQVALPDILASASDRRFAAREWASTLTSLFDRSVLRIVNDPHTEAKCAKPLQLEAARAVGISVPDTIITSDSAEAKAFVEAHHGNVVTKALNSPEVGVVDTRLWDSVCEAAINDLVFAPTIFQERVAGPADLRITVVGTEVFAASAADDGHGSPIDSRLDLDREWSAPRLGDSAVCQIRELMHRLGLRMGVLDFKLRDSGELVFLEVNPQGQWLFVEILTGMKIAAAVADLLMNSGEGRRESGPSVRSATTTAPHAAESAP